MSNNETRQAAQQRYDDSMHLDTNTISFKRIAESIILFAITVWYAYRESWTAIDIAWSVWVAHVVSGFVVLVLALIFIRSPNAYFIGKERLSERGKTIVSFTLSLVLLFFLLWMHMLLSIWVSVFLEMIFFSDVEAFAVLVVQHGFPDAVVALCETGIMKNMLSDAPRGCGHNVNLLVFYAQAYYPFVLAAILQSVYVLWHGRKHKNATYFIHFTQSFMKKNFLFILALLCIHVTLESVYNINSSDFHPLLVYVMLIVYFFPFDVLKKRATAE